MNRQQRRIAAKNGAGALRKAAHATDESIELRIRQIEKELRIATEHHYTGLMLCVFTLALRKVCKYGPERTLRVLDEVMAVINDLKDGTIDVFDIKRDAEDVGIKVVFDSEYNIIECGIFEEQKHESIQKKIDAERMKLYREHPGLKGLRLWTNPEF